MRNLIGLICVLGVVSLMTLGTSGCGERGVARVGLRGVAMLDGQPVAGAEVGVYDVPERSGVPPVRSAVTDDAGMFEVELSPGTYYVAVKLYRSGGPPYLSKLPPDPVAVTDGVADAGLFLLALESGEARPPAGTGIDGVVITEGAPVAGAVVYLYGRPDEGLKGPSHIAHARSALDGVFRVDAAPGRYYVAIRKRFDASSSGELTPGDLGGEYGGNPVSVILGAYTDIGEVSVKVIDAARLGSVDIGLPEEKGGLSVSGLVHDTDGVPLSGIHVFAYEDYKMMGKPAYKSGRTGPDGMYSIVFDRPGRYYIGARDSVGGPMEPGDMVGVYDGSEDNSVEVGPHERLDGVDITLREMQ